MLKGEMRTMTGTRSWEFDWEDCGLRGKRQGGGMVDFGKNRVSRASMVGYLWIDGFCWRLAEDGPEHLGVYGYMFK